jgi:hypothetical protein
MTEDEKIRQREFTRNPVQVTTTLRTDEGAVIVGDTEELSMNGLFLRCERRLPVDTPCHLTLILGDGQARIDVEARVASHSPDGMGIAFNAMEPESFAHLKRMVLCNAQDLDVVNAEIENHVGFKARIRP